MIGTSAIEQEEYLDYSIISENAFILTERNEEVSSYTDLDLVVTDSVTGKPIPKAMISIDLISRTAICDNQGKALIPGVLSGIVSLDVVVWGYIASSTTVFLSHRDRNLLHIKMISHC
ncbi:hypothetical protein [Daejeonella sp.]|uniref:hypothetical protein n=1 Tax=Daejeonella sp. TaxID=2805397 RepID=UPI00398374A1